MTTRFLTSRAGFLLALLYPVLLAGVLATSGCKEPPPTTLRFIVPDSFSGVFLVTADEAPVRVPPLEPNRLNIIEIPPEGVVQMRDISGFMRAVKFECQRQDGTRIPYSSPDASPKGLSLIPVFSKSGEYQYFLIGTRRERDKLWVEGKEYVKLATPVLPPEEAAD